MSLLDLLAVIVVGSSVVAGVMAGFARVSIGFLAAILGAVLGFWFYGVPASWVHRYLHSVAASNFIGFLLVFWAVLAAGALFAKLTSKLFKWTGLSWLDRLLGGAFGLVRGALIAVALIAVLLAFAPKPMPNWMVKSQVLPYAMEASNTIAGLAPGSIKTAFRESMLELRRIWNQQLSEGRGQFRALERDIAPPYPKDKKEK
ncbi:MAG: CvpA family protein [Acidobacteriota bacterium]